jgi:hypothetical protein
MNQQPYNDEALNRIYELLFCDDVELFRSSAKQKDVYPWSTIFADKPESIQLRKIIDDPNAETRVQVLAANRLRGLGEPLPAKQLFGVIVEVAMPEGLDTLAAYRDGTARYINYSGKMIVWDSPTAESSKLVEGLLSAGQRVVDQVGPWESARLAPPRNENVRLTFLVSDGLYFGEGPFNALASDQIGGPVINSAGALMGYLVNTTMDQSR